MSDQSMIHYLDQLQNENLIEIRSIDTKNGKIYSVTKNARAYLIDGGYLKNGI